jgi:tRNA threonylcarbamoyladenosine biosynthesis protein TsaE
MKRFTAYTMDDLAAPAAYLAGLLAQHPICLIYGEMGAGKTTFIKALCSALGVKDTVSSPTFSIVNEYLYPAGSIYHFDLYRLKDEAELWAIGWEEYLDSGMPCLVEWPQKAEPGLAGSEVIKVEISKANETERILAIEITRL